MSDEERELSNAEIARRRDEALKRALNTPHQPIKDKGKSPAKRGLPKKQDKSE